MARKQGPASYTVTADDLQQVVSEHAAEWGATAYVVITLGMPSGPRAYAEVTLREGLYTPSGAELVRVRYPLDPKHAEKWPGALMYAVMDAYERLRNDPWRWPAERRRTARGGE